MSTASVLSALGNYRVEVGMVEEPLKTCVCVCVCVCCDSQSCKSMF